MKILLIAESFPTSLTADLTGGVETRDFFLALGLSQKHDVTVLTMARQQIAQKQLFEGLRVIRVGAAVARQKRESVWARLLFVYQVLQLSRHLEFDIVLGSNTFSNPLAFILSRWHQKPVVAFMADLYLGNWFKLTTFPTNIFGEILERVNLRLPWKNIIVCSQTTKQKLLNYGIKRANLKVIYSGVDVTTCRELEVKKFQRPTIVFVGRLVRYKRVQDLIESLPYIKARVPKVQLVIVGEGPYRHKLEEKVIKLKLTKSVIFKGFLPTHQEVLKIIKRSHLFSLPSVVEGFGHVTIEAMACGVPYVNADIATNQEVTDNGQGGLLFKPKDSHSLGVKARKLLVNHDLYQSKIEEGMTLAQKYDWSLVLEKTEKYLLQIYKQAKKANHDKSKSKT